MTIVVLEGQHHIGHIPTQPNGWDCGFYVFHTDVVKGVHSWVHFSRFCKYDLIWIAKVDFIDVALTGIQIQGIENWFRHKDVQCLWINVAKWARRVLGFPYL